MSNKSSEASFSVSFVNYPQVILLGSYQYDFIFQTNNYYKRSERVGFRFAGDGLTLSDHDKYISGLEFSPAESKQITIKCRPARDGIITLKLDYSLLRKVEYEEIVWKVREKVEKNQLQGILNEKPIPIQDISSYSKMKPKIDTQNISSLTRNEAEKQFQNISSSKLSRDQIDATFLSIARGVFVQDPNYGYDILRLISNPKIKNEWRVHLIKAGIILNPKRTLNEIMELTDLKQKEELFEIFAYSMCFTNPQDAAMIALNIENETKRDNILVNIIFTLVNHSPDIASNLVFQISNQNLRNLVLFKLIQQLADKDRNKAITSLTDLIKNILSGANTEFIKKCAIFLASLTSPQSVLELIDNFSFQEKQTLIEQLKEYLKFQVKERKVKFEESIIDTINYTFVSITNNITSHIQHLAELGGNLSPNLITNSIQSSTCILNLFSANFSFLAGYQQAYIDILHETGQNLNYIFYPSKNGLDSGELDHLKSFMQQILKNRKSGNKMLILNLDFIPYLTIPTIFLDSETPQTKIIVQKMQNQLRGEFNVLYHSSFFSSGKIFSKLQTIFPETDFFLMNMFITYNFFNSYPLLKGFLKSLI